jgi:O-antigen/teichoic acid export membrane protein
MCAVRLHKLHLSQKIPDGPEPSLTLMNPRDFLRASALACGGNVIYQGITVVSSIFIIRALSTEDYALFGIALAAMGVLNGLADSGVSQAALTIGGRLLDNPRELGGLVRGCRRVLLTNGLLGSLVALPLWWIPASEHAVSRTGLLQVCLLLPVAFLLTANSNVYKNILLLKRKVGVVQLSEALGALVRLGLVCALMWLWPNFIAAFVLGVIVLGLQQVFLGVQALRYIGSPSDVVDDCRGEILSFVRRVFPSSLYFAFSQQVLFFLLALVADSSAVAGAGALSRLHQLFMIVTALVGAVLAPTLAVHGAASGLLRKYMHLAFIGCGFAVLLGSVIGSAPGVFLRIFGPEYAGMETAVRLLAVSSTLSTMAGAIATLNAARGWITPPALLIPTNVAALAASVVIFPLGQLNGYFSMHILVQGVMLVTVVAWAVWCLRTKIAAPRSIHFK